MGSFIEINDTLQITKEQGFPAELVYKDYLDNKIQVESFVGQVFEFRNKPNIRIYHAPPVRTFLVENIDGKWLYWGLCEILAVNYDLVSQTTSGSYRIIKMYSPEQMKLAYDLIDNREDFKYLQ